jgi:hypothetical protein
MRKQLGLGMRALVCAVTLAGVLASNAAAASPNATGPGGPGGDLPLTQMQRQSIATKEALAHQEEANPGSIARGSKSTGVTEATSCPQVVTGTVSPATSCGSYWGYVSTYTRRQVKSYYCGVATAQVISNYWWGVGATSDEYSQQTISDNWTKTDAAGQTTAWYEAVGLQGATKGSPKWTASFTYYYKVEPSGSQWDADIRTDVGYYSVPLATSVAPREPGSPYYLSTWQNVSPVHAGHWITLTGWDGAWDGTEGPTVNYDDSAIGSNGTASSMSAFDMWQIVNLYVPNYHAAGYVVW